MRDPFNLFASVLKHPRLVKELDRAVRFWKQHLMECLGETDHPGCPFISVNYTKWSLDAECRQQLGEKLGLDYAEYRSLVSEPELVRLSKEYFVPIRD